MDEYVACQYVREEEFLEVHYEMVDALLARLGEEWKPNYQCNDRVREQRARLIAAGQLTELALRPAPCSTIAKDCRQYGST